MTTEQAKTLLKERRRGHLHAITVPCSRLLLAPWRKRIETVPPVVGVQVIVVGWPALIMNPGGRVNGFAWLCAAAMASKELTMHKINERILEILYN